MLANKTQTPKIQKNQQQNIKKEKQENDVKNTLRWRAKVIFCQELKKNVFELFCCQLFVGGDCGSEVHWSDPPFHQRRNDNLAQIAKV